MNNAKAWYTSLIYTREIDGHHCTKHIANRGFTAQALRNERALSFASLQGNRIALVDDRYSINSRRAGVTANLSEVPPISLWDQTFEP